MSRVEGAYKSSKAVDEYIKERERFGWRLRGERAVVFGEIKTGDTVLDLCCGPGLVAKVVKETVGDSGKVVGIDISEDFVKHAQEFCGGVNTVFKTGNVENLDQIVEDQRFDAVLLLASWLWIEDKKKLLDQVKSHLKPDGKFVLSLSSDNLDDQKTNEFYWKYRENLKKQICEAFPKTNLSYFDNLPVINKDFIDAVTNQVSQCGYRLKSNYEVERVLSLDDKIFIYENPARTEWVGDFPPETRLSIIKKALNDTAGEIEDLRFIKRHTHYLVFGLHESDD